MSCPVVNPCLTFCAVRSRELCADEMVLELFGDDSREKKLGKEVSDQGQDIRWRTVSSGANNDEVTLV